MSSIMIVMVEICIASRLQIEAQVCRIQSGSYWDNYGLYKTAAPNVQFIFVYYNNAWHVGAFGVYTKYVHPSVDIIKTFTPKGGKYRGF